MNSLYRLCHLGPVTTLSCILVLYSVMVVDSVLWLLPIRTAAGALNIFYMTLHLFLLLSHFFKVILVSPGYVSKDWRPKNFQDTDDLEYCQMCSAFKPPRAHHCKICQRCILKMDHHCPWLNNCCGHFNQTNYLFFIVLVHVGAIYGLFIVFVTLWTQWLYRSDYTNRVSKKFPFFSFAFYINFLTAVILALTLFFSGLLLYRQLKSLILNATFIERLIIKKAKLRHKKLGKKFIYPYDYGIKVNILQVVNWDLKPVGDGYNWTVVEGTSKYTLSIEQKEQKKEDFPPLETYDAIEPYSGEYFPFSHGLRTWLSIPWIFEPRLPLKPGERVLVFSSTSFWMCGVKIVDEAFMIDSVIRGWFPSRCVIKVQEKFETL